MSLFFSLVVACVPGLRLHTASVDGETRSWYLYVPEAATGPLPVVFAFHGGGTHGKREGRGFARYTDLVDNAEQDAFIVAFPNSLEGNWNDGRFDPDHLPDGVFPSGVLPDDVAFFDTMLERVLAETDADPTRVYLTGVSNGAFFSQRLACERTEQIAAVAGVVGGIAPDTAATCAPGVGLPVLSIVGDGDPLVPYEGGATATDRGETLSSDAMMALWRGVNGCDEGTPDQVALPDLEEDGCRIYHQIWLGCAASVERVRMAGGGHGWPGKLQYAPRRVIGDVCQELDTNGVLWAFMKEHRRAP